MTGAIALVLLEFMDQNYHLTCSFDKLAMQSMGSNISLRISSDLATSAEELRHAFRFIFK